MKLKLLFAGLGLVSSAVLYAQNAPGPDAAQLPSTSIQGNASSRNGGSMDLFTGINNVNIPIYDYSLDGLDLGVSVSYCTQGIKVDQIASTIGLGWSLNANSYITREVHGIEDEMTIRAVNNNAPNNAIMAVPEQRGSWVSLPVPTPYYMQKESYQNDVFTAVLAGRVLTFTIQKDLATGQCQVAISPKCEVQIKMVLDGNDVNCNSLDTAVAQNMNQHVLTFEITDEQGNVFYFERGDHSSKDYKVPGLLDQFTYESVDSWRLNKIVTYTGAIVRYYYTEISHVYPYYKHCEVRETYPYTTSSIFNDSVKNSANPIHNPPTGDISMDTTTQYWVGVMSHISRIEYPNGTIVNFNMETDPNKLRCDLTSGPYVLNSISISSKLDNNISNSFKYVFNHYYSHAPHPNNTATSIAYGTSCNSIYNSYNEGSFGTYEMQTRLRLCLQSITKVGYDGVTVEPYYSFQYNATPLPPRLSPQQDYYGFYNNAVSWPLSYTTNNGQNFFNIPNVAVALHAVSIQTASGKNYSGMYGIDKSPNFTYTQAGVLTKVTNAMGGSQEFYYGITPLDNFDWTGYPLFSHLEAAGGFDGLIVDSVITKDGYNNSNDVTTVYTYSSGQRLLKGGHTWYPTIVNGAPGDPPPLTIYEKIYSNKFVAPQDCFRGSNHGYSVVQESTYGFGHALLGKIEYDFSNVISLDDPSMGNVKKIVPKGNDGQYNNDVFYYREPASVCKTKIGMLLGKKVYDNTNNVVGSTVNTYSYVVSNPNPIPGQYYADINHSTVSISYDYFYDDIANLTQTVQTKYYPNGSIQDVQSFAYDGRDNLLSATSTDSRGLQKSTLNTYSYGVNNQFLIGQQNTRVLGDGINYIVGYTISTEPGWHSGPNDLATWKTEHPLSAGAGYSPTATIDKHYTYDDNTNVIETSYENGKRYSASIWDSRIGQKVASVDNARFSQIAYTSFEGQVAASGVQDANKGNWEYDPSKIFYGTSATPSVTGRCHYKLGNSSISSVNQLEYGQDYVVSLWANTTPKYYQNGQLMSFPPSTASVGFPGSWALYSVIVTGTGNPFVLTSSSILTKIDELRMYPVGASMATTTYEPMIGPSSQCDARNNILYFEYDAMGRQTTVKDIDKNIIKYSKTVVQGQDN
ncbi:hypothetical protein [Taibaiella soli]|uniref:YD repeat-containing protein n=1 Tax=Taibaiella soli TaxID=1649169 RepID=A0A2W2AE64_9BACT|nr:hypothetical protein [Taibaiella soli]PZF73755.1 hypothetical protein DN068_07090 [Taibaiella soli]